MKMFFYRLKDCKANNIFDRRSINGKILTKDWIRSNVRLEFTNFEHLVDEAIEEFKCTRLDRNEKIKQMEKKYLSNNIVDKKEIKQDETKVDTQDNNESVNEDEIDKVESKEISNEQKEDNNVVINIKDMNIKDVIDLIYKESNKKYTKKYLKEKTPEELYKIFEELN